MSKTKFVDFKAVKAAITMEQVLEHYGLMDRFKRSGDSLSGPCPIHKGDNPTQFRVSISKNIWNCFSECKHGGNVLDFIARMENVSIHAAALKALEWFNLDSEALAANGGQDEEESEETPRPRLTPAKTAPKKTETQTETSAPNKPLKFRLEKLNAEHPYLTERGLTREIAMEFGAGYCEKGMMANRIAIPILNDKGEVVAYAGRCIGKPDENTPKYKLPQGFRKSLEVFNIDRAAKEPVSDPLIIVEGFFGCMKLHQNGCRKVVALMGSSMSLAQEELIRKHISGKTHVIVMLDEDEAGQVGREDIAVRLSKFTFVKVHSFAKEGQQPEELTPEEVIQITGGGQ
jgi:DNA primase